MPVRVVCACGVEPWSARHACILCVLGVCCVCEKGAKEPKVSSPRLCFVCEGAAELLQVPPRMPLEFMCTNLPGPTVGDDWMSVCWGGGCEYAWWCDAQ